jgi:hypothetical protein
MVLAVDAAVFHSSFYANFTDPDSTTGRVEIAVRNEIARATPNRMQVLAVGHSRMALRPHLANAPELRAGYTFATIAVPGASPRCWYYMLRDVDPSARRYAAILIPSDDYDDRDVSEDLADRISDLHYLAARLRITDLLEFPATYTSLENRAISTYNILLRGLIYRRDLQKFLRHPAERLENVRAHREHSAEWNYGYTGDERSLNGLAVDWNQRAVTFPPDLPPALRDSIRDDLFSPPPPATGANHRFHSRWFRRIVERYRGSGTRIIFLRLPRRPVIPPAVPTPDPNGSVRVLARETGVTAIDETFFNDLESPEWFADALHLNAAGSIRFTRMLVQETARILADAGSRHAL